MTADFEHCCGCRACESVCPTRAITFEISENSFLYPHIDNSKCINCKKCERVCDFLKEKDNDKNILSSYGFKYDDINVLKHSTSGGAFTAISYYILENNGVVFGAVMHDDITVWHEMATNTKSRDKMRGSKYVQSDMQSVYEQIKEILNEGRTVLFTGTPCQTAAVKSVFGDRNSNLILVDFLCHGVNSCKMLIEHKEMLEKKFNKKITSLDFRPKELTWNGAVTSVSFDNEKKKNYYAEAQSFYNIFTSNIALRPSCYNCKYRSQHRYSDITIADFWGYEKFYDKEDKTGLSLLFANSKVGERIIEKVKLYGEIKEIPFDDVEKRIALSPPKKNKNSEVFLKDYSKNGYEYCVKKYFPITIKYRIKFTVKKLIRKSEAKRNKMV